VNRVLSLVLLVGGATLLVAGVYVILGLGAALIAAGTLMMAAEWLTP